MDRQSHAHFRYDGYNRDVCIALDGDDADYLPRMLASFADFLRASGFVYVGVKPVEDGWLFHKKFDQETDDDSWSYVEHSEFFQLLDDDEEEQQAKLNDAADKYWDKVFDEADIKMADVGFEFTKGNTVFYNGRGQPDQQHGHGGFKGVTLLNSRGTVFDVQDSPVGKRVLVKFDNWFDGHNGFGADPDAKMRDTSYWWTDPANLSLSN